LVEGGKIFSTSKENKLKSLLRATTSELVQSVLYIYIFEILYLLVCLVQPKLYSLVI
jgi:hypothetical protein